MFTTTIDGKEVELKPEDLKPGEGYAIITPEKVPDGYYNEDAVQKRIQDRIKNTAENARKEAEEDAEFQKRILSKYNISLDEEGKPKGLKPDVDVEELKQNITKEVSSQYESKLEEAYDKLSKRDQAVIESSILSAVNGQFKEEWTKSFDGEKPLAVEKFSKLFKVDDSGQAVLKDENGGLKYKGDGSPFTPADYLLNPEKYGDIMKDKRQRGSGFGESGTFGAGKKKSDISTEEKAALFEKWRSEGKKPLEQWNKLK